VVCIFGRVNLSSVPVNRLSTVAQYSLVTIGPMNLAEMHGNTHHIAE
jgi:hypothetical protein